MTAMRAVDAAFLAMERPNEPRHLGAVMIFRPSAEGPLTYQTVRELLADRLRSMPSARRVVVERHSGFTRPEWRNVDRVDLDVHVQRRTVEVTGDDEGQSDFEEIVAREHATPLDRGRPLWKLFVIDGLPDDHVAVYAKVHTAALDDTTGVDLMTALLDVDEAGGATMEVPVEYDDPDDGPPPWARRLVGSTPDQLLTAAGFPGRLLSRASRAIGDQLPGLTETAVEVARRTPGLGAMAKMLPAPSADDGLEHPTGRAPRLSFNAPIGPHRRFAAGSFPTAEVLELKAAAGVSFHDVLVATCAGALRRWLLAADELPTSPVVAMLPVLVRGDGPGQRGRHVSSLVVPLPTNVADPVARLRRVSETLAEARRRHVALPASLQQDIAMFAPPAVAGLAARLLGASPHRSLLSPTVNLGITNVPGPRRQVSLAGRPFVSGHPVLSVSDDTPLHLGLQAGPTAVGLGVIADRDHVDDLRTLVDTATIELAEMRAAVRGTRKRRTS